VLILVSSSNPKDWKTPEFTGSQRNEGDNIAGIVEKVGTNVAEFKPATG
jgi:NADPH:quinone reductase